MSTDALSLCGAVNALYSYDTVMKTLMNITISQTYQYNYTHILCHQLESG